MPHSSSSTSSKQRHWRLYPLITQLRDGTATAEEQNEIADELSELLELLRSHADDTEAGVVPTLPDSGVRTL
ncbi:hypothetical protein [Amycolatopsis sp. NPDC004378]